MRAAVDVPTHAMAREPTPPPSSGAPAKAPRKRKGGRGRRALKLGPDDGPRRSCIVCRASGETDALLRFARAPDGAVGFDVGERLPGRGAWVCATTTCLTKATDPKHGGFARAFDAAVVFDGAVLRDDVKALLRAQVLERLGLLRRRGALITGREEVLRRVADLAAIGLASDLSDGSRHELSERATVPLIALPTMPEVTAAIGHDKPVGVVGVPRVEGAGLLAALRRWHSLEATAAPKP